MSQRSLLHFGVTQKRKNDAAPAHTVSSCEIQLPAKKPKVDTSSRPKVFQEAWLRQFDWLEFNSDSKRMFCKVCQAANCQNSFTKEGAVNLQKSTVVKHNDSKDHRHALEAHHMRKQLYRIDVAEENNTSELKTTVSDSEIHLFRTVYFVASENRPNSDVNKQLRYLKASGVDPKVCDIHSDSIQEVQSSLVRVLDEDIKRELDSTKYYGITVDESTDLSVHKKLVIYIRYVCPSDLEVKTKLLGNVRIPDGTACTIVSEVLSKLKSIGLATENFVGLGSDGASVMFGRKGGVGVLLSKEAPYMVHVHCVAHRLALACSDAAKGIPYLKTYKDTLKNLFIHVNGSGVRSFKLEAMQTIMDEPHLKLKDPISIRWLAMESAVKTIHQCYGAIVMYLQSNEGKNTVGDVIATGLLKEVLHYKFPAFTAILADILSVIGVLCKQLQLESLDLSQFVPMKESTIGRLEGLSTLNGEHMDTFEKQLTSNGNKVYFKGIQLTHANEKNSVDNMKKEYIRSVCEHIDSRMSTESSPVMTAFSVLEPQTNEILTEKETEDNLQKLSTFYDVNLSELKREHTGVKTLLKGSYRNISYQAFCKMVARRHQQEYPIIHKMCHMSLCIPVTSVACERGFSLQNRIKVKSRTSLTPDNLDRLMKLSNGPSLEEFPYERAIRHWHREKKRRLAKLYTAAKPKET